MIARRVWGPLARVWLVGLAALGLAGGPARADLFSYVKKPEPEFAWKLKGQRETLGARVYELEMTSQVWQSIPWKHDLLVVVPAKVKPAATLFLWNQGGKPSLTSQLMALDLATRMQAPACFLYGIPNQPLFGGLKEDALIAETFVRYLDTEDEEDRKSVV